MAAKKPLARPAEAETNLIPKNLVRDNIAHDDIARDRPPNKGAIVAPELVIITGMSGSGKGSVLRSLEDLGYYSVDNLPVELIPKFAELVRDSSSNRQAALVVDVREGAGLKKLPGIVKKIRGSVNVRLLFL
jgi:RNase adapter protein RapZ